MSRFDRLVSAVVRLDVALSRNQVMHPRQQRQRTLASSGVASTTRSGVGGLVMLTVPSTDCHGWSGVRKRADYVVVTRAFTVTSALV